MSNRICVIFFIITCFICFSTCKKPAREMAVSTGGYNILTSNSVEVSGEIIDLGEGALRHGFFYSTTKNFAIKGSLSTNLGKPNKTGSFANTLQNLESGVAYYYKAYLSNTNDTVYGLEEDLPPLCISPSPPIVGAITQPTCAVPTGSVVLSGLPSSGSWTLTRIPGGTTLTGTGTSITVTGLPAGTTYTFTVTNSSGCVSAASGNVTINVQPASPSAPVVGTITQPTCAVSTGSVVLSGLPSSGTWTLTRIPGGTKTTGTGTSTTVTGLPAGSTYTFTVTNSSGCVSAASGNVTINTQPASPSAPVVGTITQPTCSVPSGSVVLSGLPSTGTWTLTRTPGGTKTTGTGTSTTVTALPAGSTYTFTVTNSLGCISAASGNIVINAQPTAPSVTTNAATSIGPTTATLNGIVNANNASTTVTFEYGTSTSYGSTINATPGQVTGSTNTSVNAVLTGLSANTEYHYRVNAVNCAGTVHGDDINFTTTSGCEDIYEPNNTLETANTSAFSTLGTAYYSNTIYPTLDIDSDDDYYRLNITRTGTISISLYQSQTDFDIEFINNSGEVLAYSIFGQRENIIYPITETGYYYIRILGSYTCMTYSLNVIWGGADSKTGVFTDYRDGKRYDWVAIGAQIWMAENLNVGTRINGSQEQTSNGIIEKYCYNDTESNCDLYGGFYQWDEMMEYSGNGWRGVCPEGWHVPSDDEWKTLEMNLGMNQISADAEDWRGSNEGGKLKSTSSLWNPPNTGATNESGFSALPSGDRNSSGSFEAIGVFANFWTRTFRTEDQQISWRKLDYEHSQVARYWGNRKYGTACRCIKDYITK